ncbi:MAG TPA: serine O-acetyltransferase [Aliidongia sp.]|nr:serine O-acetyltransferase [Aliidongia sp.]
MFLQNLRDDIKAVMARDPAARSFWEVALCYPGIQVLAAHRVAHWLWHRDLKLPARWLSQFARTMTGIEIHPSAKIGRRLFIDHGMGVVIGATAEVGDDCTLYQGVTLGGTLLHKGKRHPTLGNNVIVGSGAQVLGGFTVGDGARVGANAVVVAPVEAHTTVVGIPAKPISHVPGRDDHCDDSFVPYGTPCEDLPDPVARALKGLLDEVACLRARVNELEAQAPRVTFDEPVKELIETAPRRRI